MLTIWKYEIPIQDCFELEIPADYRILEIKTQNKIPVMWISVITTNEKEKVRFRIYGTGHSIPIPATHLNYIGTLLMQGDTIAWHLFKDTGGEI